MALEEASDGVLAQRAADGDSIAFGVLVRRHAPFLIAFATKLTGSRADADDCVQEGLITAWQKLDELDDPDRVRAWLTRIVSRKATDRLRARRPTVDIDELELSATSGGPESHAVVTSQLEALRAALRDLGDELRSVWLLKEVAGYSYDEIAEELGVSTATVRGRLARARQGLLERMKDWR
jgi:RNA polymerase sigma-70 factor (ECF subfamily)